MVDWFRAYWAFRDHFPDQAEALLNTMDTNCKRTLLSQSNSGSMNSLTTVARTSSIPPRPTRPAMSAAGKKTSVFPFAMIIFFISKAWKYAHYLSGDELLFLLIINYVFFSTTVLYIFICSSALCCITHINSLCFLCTLILYTLINSWIIYLLITLKVEHSSHLHQIKAMIIVKVWKSFQRFLRWFCITVWKLVWLLSHFL